MYHLLKPSSEAVQHFMADQATRPFTYAEVGASRTGTPDGFKAIHTRFQVGKGKAAFEAGAEAVRDLRFFNTGWTDAFRNRGIIEPDAVVALRSRAICLWVLTACRVIYIIDEKNESSGLFRLAYGTLPAHAFVGEEWFTMEWSAEDDVVWFSVSAFFKSASLFVVLTSPITRYLQKRFARDAARALQADISQ